MRNSTKTGTPKIIRVQDKGVTNSAEKISNKKLKQARLPFKIIAPSVSSDGTKTTTTSVPDKATVSNKHSTDGKKRKISYETDDDSIIVIKEDHSLSKENVEIIKAGNKKKKITEISSDDTAPDLNDSNIESEDDNIKHNDTDMNSSAVSSGSKKVLDLKVSQGTTDKRKSTGTPSAGRVRKDKNGSATKLQIKLPLSSNKKKRKKANAQFSLHQCSSADNSLNDLTLDLSSDDIDNTLNPQKRKKMNTSCDDISKSETAASHEEKIEIISSDSEPEEEKKEFTEITKSSSSSSLPIKDTVENENTEKSLEKCNKNVTEKLSPNSEKNIENDDGKSSPLTVSSDGDKDGEENAQSENETDDETNSLTKKSLDISSDVNENLIFKNMKKSLTNETNLVGSSAKCLTQKQRKLFEQRRKAREEKERKLQEEKIKKQQEKEEKEMAKKREREEKEEEKRKEREEKEEQKRKEREEKERKRLADIEAKNEEKRKKNEAKEEEIRKKEEERKRKEQEKEEAELKKKKAAQAFTKFFVSKTPTTVQLKCAEDSNTSDDTKLLAFRPFQIKGDMKLAPICRRILTTEEKNRLDELLGCKNENNLKDNDADFKEIVQRIPLPISLLYLSELVSGKIRPGKWRRTSTESKDDVIIVEDELERVGQEIVEYNPGNVREEMHVKYYKFHDNRRPPYYGTWRKKSLIIKPRNPFQQDKKFFDYDVDSDDEWEEEEPGESLEDGSDEDKEKESEEDDYEVDNEWFVPHGHLSDEELQNEDEFGMGDDNTREAQKVKLKILQQEFAQEMKKKTEKIKPRLIGCIWADINGNQPTDCAKILWDMLDKKSMLLTDAPLIDEPEIDRSTEPNSPSNGTNNNAEKATDKLKPISLSDKMIKDLIQLIHGNNHSKNFLINEFIAYIEKTEQSVKNGDLRKPLKTVIRDKIEELAEWQAVNANALNIQEMEQCNSEMNDKKKKKVKRRLCWVVRQEILDKMDLSKLELKNSWKYTLTPKLIKTKKEEMVTTEAVATTIASEVSTLPADESEKGKASTEVLESVKNETRPDINSCKKIHSTNVCKSSSPATSKEKKRVPLLMSVARGQQISTPTKNKLISQFLQKQNKNNTKSITPNTPTSRSNLIITNDVDEVILLD